MNRLPAFTWFCSRFAAYFAKYRMPGKATKAGKAQCGFSYFLALLYFALDTLGAVAFVYHPRDSPNKLE